MKYTYTKIERKVTSTGKAKADVSVMDENGTEQSGVTVWADYPDFATMKEGDTTLGEVQIKVNGKFTNKTLYPERTNTLYPKKNNIAQAQAKKAEYIEAAQERKNTSIAYFNAVNSSISVMGKYDTDMDIDKYQTGLVIWRDWFLSEWEKYDAKPMSEKSIPFS